MHTPHSRLSRRERQIMDVLYRKGSATAAEVLESIPEPPSYSAVRALLRILEEKGHVKHEQRAARYVFMPTMPREKAKISAVRHLVQTLFDGSHEEAVAALLDSSSLKLSDPELDRLQGLIDKARKGGRNEFRPERDRHFALRGSRGTPDPGELGRDPTRQ